MAKPRIIFFCQNCGAQSPKWIGRCPSCGEWNTYAEEVVHREKDKDQIAKLSTKKDSGKPVPVNEIKEAKENRINTNNNELNRVLGGGL
ncbi:MAG: DNA repair protein RadA, partial [Bacteroidales bacterium]|nr:DNA repair protein RadA [Bacteroidales bacterium]